MSWRLAPSLETLRRQINARWPRRNRASDGTIGNAAHAASKSDHNPNERGVVTAMDITNDTSMNGPTATLLAERLRKSQNPRIKYVISNRRMFSSYAAGGVPPWTWRPYNGANPHTSHVHISVIDEVADDYPWRVS